MSEPKSTDKPFEVSKQAVWEAYQKVKSNAGAAGVDGCSIEEFEIDLRNNLYKIWNRLSSGSYFPPAVRAVPIPKKSGGGSRILGVPTVADRIAQTVVARQLEPRMEKIFHPDSYGYRPRRGPLDAVAVCRERCWGSDWVLDLDIRSFFDSCPHDLIVKAVEAKTRIVYCKDGRRPGTHGTVSFTFLGYTFRPRKSWNAKQQKAFTGFLPAMSRDALTAKGREVRRWRLHQRTGHFLAGLAEAINPIVRGWMNYWGRYGRSQMNSLLQRINTYLLRWARAKYKRLRAYRKAKRWWDRVTTRDPDLFAHWRWMHNV